MDTKTKKEMIGFSPENIGKKAIEHEGCGSLQAFK